MKRLIYPLLIAVSLILLVTASNVNSGPCPMSWWLHCDNDLNTCISGRFYPCANNVNWSFDFGRVSGPGTTVIHFLIASIGNDTPVHASDYPPGARYHLSGGATSMIQQWDQLTIYRWSGPGGDFTAMDLRTSYVNGNPNGPQGP
jgi:hypothetical protein